LWPGWSQEQLGWMAAASVTASSKGMENLSGWALSHGLGAAKLM